MLQGQKSLSRLRHVWLPILLAIGTVLLVRVGVSYANFGSQCCTGSSGTTNGVFLANNDVHNAIERNLTTDYHLGLTQTVDYDYASVPGFRPATWAASACSDAGFDVCVFDADFGDNGLAGWTACDSDFSGSDPNVVCGLSFVRINLFFDPPEIRVACHELGHTVGLRHSSEQDSCMKSTGGDSIHLSAHDRNHIATEY